MCNVCSKFWEIVHVPPNLLSGPVVALGAATPALLLTLALTVVLKVPPSATAVVVVASVVVVGVPAPALALALVPVDVTSAIVPRSFLLGSLALVLVLLGLPPVVHVILDLFDVLLHVVLQLAKLGLHVLVLLGLG